MKHFLVFCLCVSFLVVGAVGLSGCEITRQADGGFQIRPIDGAVNVLADALMAAIEAYNRAETETERQSALQQISEIRAEIEAWQQLRNNTAP